MKISRRDVIVGAAATAALLPRKAHATALTLVLTFPDSRSTLTFSQAAATQLDDYVGVFVHQLCYVQRQDVYTVFFRPDAGGGRDEIVVERGNTLTSGTDDLVGYTATVKNGGSTVATIPVDYHFWNSRWRWQSAARPLVRTPADLIAARLVPPHDSTLLYGLPTYVGIDNSSVVPSFGGPMDKTRISWNGGPGERDEIGPMTEACAQYVIFPSNAAARDVMLAQAEGLSSFGHHIRDPATNAPMSYATHTSLRGVDMISGSFFRPRPVAGGSGPGTPPAAPTVSSTPGGTHGIRTYLVGQSYVYPDGQSDAGAQTIFVCPANEVMVIQPPAPSSDSAGAATGWYAFFGLTPDPTYSQTRCQSGLTPLGMSDVFTQKATDWLGDNQGGVNGLFDAWDFSTTHQPAPAYLPYLLTDDPYWLEEVQALGNHSANYYGGADGPLGYGIPAASEARDSAWGFRSLVYAKLASASVTTLPSWFLPVSYWDGALTHTRAFCQEYMDSTAICHALFHTFPIFANIEVYQYGYLAHILGFMKWNGSFSAWDDFYEWQLGSIIPMLNGSSGWCNECVAPYALALWIPPYIGNPGNVSIGSTGAGQFDANTPASWSDWYAIWLANQLPAYPTDAAGHSTSPLLTCGPNTLGPIPAGPYIAPLQSGGDFYIILQGAMNWANKNGVAAAVGPKAWMDAHVPDLMVAGVYGSAGAAAKWSIAGGGATPTSPGGGRRLFR